jgi:catechol 2,3-dioxygenase-like lactoylglutathione lyase family enzyme
VIPIVRTAHLPRLVAFYVEALGFRLVQQVPHVVALLACGPVRLQLWQSPCAGGRCVLTLDGAGGNVFAVHAHLRRLGRHLLSGNGPELKPWGAWEFTLTDLDANQLVFMQWIDGVALPREHGTARNSKG